MVAARGDLRQVRDAQHLPHLSELMQQPPDHLGDAAADARVDFVEDERRRRARRARDHREREADPRELAARGDLRERPQRHARMARDAELDLLEPVRAAFGERHERDLEAAARHRQFLHAGGHRHAERLRRLRARLRQLLRVGQIRLLRLVGNRLQRAQIGRGVELGELRAARLVLVVQRLGRQPELARGRVQRVEPRLDLREPVRVEVEPLRVVRQRIRSLLQLDLGRLERCERVVERGVVFGEAPQPRHDRAQLREHRVVGFGDRAERALHAVDQVRRMREPLVLGGDLVPFARLRRELVELGELPRELFAFELALALVRLRGVDRVRRVAPCAIAARDGGRVGREPRVRVEQLALRVRAHQQLMRVLAVDVDEHLAHFAQLRERRARAVDEGARAAVRVDDAPQHHRVVGVERVLVEPTRDAVVRREFGADVGPAAAGAHDARVGALAERERERIDQDRFAGARFA